MFGLRWGCSFGHHLTKPITNMNTIYKSLLMAAMVSAGAMSQHTANAQKNNNAAEPVVPASPKVPHSPKIGEFTSVRPTGQTQTITIPETHTFQMLIKSGVTRYTGSTETLPGNNDFTAYIGKNNKSSKKGYLSINHENNPGGVSILDLDLNESSMLWEVEQVRKVDFSSLVKTQRNCSGGITPWGTIITSEEAVNLGDANGDGYDDIGWQVEIDPVTGKIMDYDGDGKPDKLWGHGRFNHENIAVSADGGITYQTEDGGSSCVFKFIADTKGDLSKGSLYVLRRDGTGANTGHWVKVPNTSQAELNNMRTLAPSLGGTNWSSPEDIEFGPDGKMYFTSKGTGTIWRFKDDGMTVSEIEAWVTNKQYRVDFEGGSQMESWGTGIDNLTFDGEGNLWGLQDGGRNNLWVIYPDHTPEKPHLKLFMTTPSGSESTGLTFSPDFKYGFISIQHPNRTNAAKIIDAAGNEVQFDRDVTLVFARKEHLGKEPKAIKSADANLKVMEVYPNPFLTTTQIKVNLPEAAEVVLEVYTTTGKIVKSLANGKLAAGEHIFNFTSTGEAANGMYMACLRVDGQAPVTSILQAGK